jgi:hypothetical protein
VLISPPGISSDEFLRNSEWALTPVFNLTPRVEIGPQEVKFFPRGEVISQGWRPSVRPFVLLTIRECAPLGVNEGVNNPPRGQSSPQGAKFTPGGKVHPPLGEKLTRGETDVVKHWPQVRKKCSLTLHLHTSPHLIFIMVIRARTEVCT